MEPLTTVAAVLTECAKESFAAGIIGNLVASVGYDHLVKPGISAGLTELRQMTAAGVTQENHDLLRAIWVAQNQALALACEAVLTEDKRLRPGSLAIPENLVDLDAWLSGETDAEVKLLLKLRADALRSVRQSNKAELEALQRELSTTIDDVPTLLKAGAEIDASPTAASDELVEIRTRATEKFITILGATLPHGPPVPAPLERVLRAHWFDYLRVAFREALKHNDKARHAFQFHIWEKIEGLPCKLDEALERLDRLDQAFDQLIAQVRALVDAVNKAYEQSRRENQLVLQSVVDLHRYVQAVHEKLTAAMSALRERVEFFHTNFKVEPVRIAKRMPTDPLDTFLLRPEARVIPLIGRTQEFRSLWSWVHRPDPLSICVIGVGPGAGKTRLGLELLLALQQQKNGVVAAEALPPWRIGRVGIDTLRNFDRNKDWAEWIWDRPTVLMVDYALEALDALEKWTLRVMRHVRECHDSDVPCPPLRILLIEREASAKHLQQRLIDVTGEPHWFAPREAPMPLHELSTPELRLSILQQAIQAVPRNPGGAAISTALDDETRPFLMQNDFRQPLYLIMAAWEAVQGGNLRAALRLGQSKLVERSATREQLRIEHSIREDASRQTSRRTMAVHFAAYATLCRGLDAGESVAAAKQELSAAGLTQSFDAPELAALLAHVNGEADKPNAIAPIRPDIVGERLLFDWMRRLTARNPEELTEFISRAVRQTPQSLQTLFRMTSDLPVAEAQAMDNWLHAVLNHWDTHDPGLLEQFDTELPRYHSGLVKLSAAAAELLGKKALSKLDADASDEDRAVTARKLNDAGVRLGEARRLVKALAMSKEAVNIRRALYARNPETYGNDLAGSLDNLGIRLGELDRKPDALAMSEEAVNIRRALYARNPEAYGNDLAGSLHNLGIRLSELDRKPEALAMSEEAVNIYRALYARNPEVYGNDLARSLDNLGIRLSELDRKPEALAMSEEAVNIRRALYARNPEAYGNDLAGSLDNLGNRLGRTRPQARCTGDERGSGQHPPRAIYARNPEAYGNDLAGLAPQLGHSLERTGPQARGALPRPLTRATPRSTATIWRARSTTWAFA